MTAMIAVIGWVVADPRFRSDFTVTFDLREATYDAELADGETLAAVLGKKRTDFQNRFAVVVPESLHLLAGQGRIWSNSTYDVGRRASLHSDEGRVA